MRGKCHAKENTTQRPQPGRGLGTLDSNRRPLGHRAPPPISLFWILDRVSRYSVPLSRSSKPRGVLGVIKNKWALNRHLTIYHASADQERSPCLLKKKVKGRMTPSPSTKERNGFFSGKNIKPKTTKRNHRNETAKTSERKKIHQNKENHYYYWELTVFAG